MKVFYTNQSLLSLEETIQFLSKYQGIPISKVHGIVTKLLDKSDSLRMNPLMGQKEEYLNHLDIDHRRLIVGHFKIIYRVEGDNIYVTDFFDTRQDPTKMKG